MINTRIMMKKNNMDIKKVNITMIIIKTIMKIIEEEEIIEVEEEEAVFVEVRASMAAIGRRE